jgi:hypothetical protein
VTERQSATELVEKIGIGLHPNASRGMKSLVENLVAPALTPADFKQKNSPLESGLKSFVIYESRRADLNR